MLDGLNLLVSVSKFGMDTTKIRWYHIGISYRIDLKSWYRPSLIHSKHMYALAYLFFLLLTAAKNWSETGFAYDVFSGKHPVSHTDLANNTLRAPFQLSVFYTYVHARKGFNSSK